MKKRLIAILSLVMAVILFTFSMPIVALEDTSIEEIEELREENVKHFRMPDGKYKAVVYSEPVHRRDSEGNWQDINNTLVATEEDGVTNYATFDGRIKFSKNIKNANGRLFELSENGYKISLSLIDENVKSSSADIKNHGGKRKPTIFDSEEKKLEKMKEVDNLTKVKYNDIREDIDIEYEIYSNNIKESIIVNSRQSEYEYSFKLKLNKLTAMLNEDGTVSIMDEETGRSIYSMPAPFMFDDNGVLSTDVYYTLTQKGKYEYELTVTASTEWINATGRKFPVTIDPTIETNTSYGEAYVSSANPNSNYKKPSDGQLLVSTTHRTFLKFEMPTLSASATILDAVLDIKFYFTSGESANISAYTVPYSWNENTITWNNSVAANTIAENSVTPFVYEYLSSGSGTELNPAYMYLDMTSVVKDWYAGKPNNGIAIKTSSGSVIFKGYNSGENLRPTLELTYVESNSILQGTYFARNVEEDKYMQTIFDNSDIGIDTLNGDINQKWKIFYLHNGYYKIITFDETKALTAASNGDLTLEIYSYSNNQMWIITEDSNGYYKLSSKSNTSMYISAGETFAQLMTTQSNNTDEWIISKYIDYVLLYIPDSSGDLDTSMKKMSDAVDSALKTNTNMYGLCESSSNRARFLDLLSNASIFSCMTHGTEDKIYFGDMDDSNVQYVNINDIKLLDDSALDHVEFVLLSNCDNGMNEEDGDNMVNAIADKGAKFVLGFNHKIDKVESIYWTEQFMTSLSLGNSIENAMAFADEQTKDYFDYDDINDATTSENYRYYRGDVTDTPCA